MSVRANWFVGLDDEPATGVPRSLPPAEERVEDVGVPFDLREPGSLMAEIERLIAQESALFNQGITCAVKDRSDTSCSACAYAHHEEDGHPLQPLCHTGREQERALTQHAHLALHQAR